MAGGTFTGKKVRPGVYVNVVSNKKNASTSGQKGTVLIPFIVHDFGPTGEMINISSSYPELQFEKLGHSVYDTSNANMLLVREALKRAANVIVWIIKTGTKATGSGGGLTGTAKYGGTRGNKLSFAVTANTLDDTKFDITISLDGVVVSTYTGIANIGEAVEIEDPWIDFAKTANDSVLAATAGVNLTSATAATAINSDVTNMLDAVENAAFDVILFPSENTDLATAFVSKVKTLNDNIGKNVIGVMPNMAADYYGIINVTNSVKTSDGVTLTTAQAAAWVAGATAAAECTEALSYQEYDDAVEIVGVKGSEAAELALKQGQFFFSYFNGKIVVEDDINSLVTVGEKQDVSYKKNRVVRTIYEVVKSIKDEFPPNKYSNSDTNWDIMDEHGQAILSYFEGIDAIDNVEESDFEVDRDKSAGDHTFVNLQIKPIDSAEKLYFTIYTN